MNYLEIDPPLLLTKRLLKQLAVIVDKTAKY